MNANFSYVSTIRYASVLPGTGKTSWAINTLLDSLEHSNQITIYVAPTYVLLQEVADMLVKYCDRRDRNKIHLIKAVAGGASTVGRQIDLLLHGGKDGVGNKYLPLDYGIILCTHEAFTRMRHESFEEERVTKRSKISIIFDEARKCTMNVKTLTMPFDIAQELFHKHLQISETGLGKKKSRWPTPTLTSDPGDTYRPLNIINGDTEALNAMFARNKKLRRIHTELVSLIDSASGAATKLYASITVKGKQETAYAIVHTLLVPYKLFYGWKDVVLLSAFFENSQMYHLLKMHDIGQEERREGETKKAHTLRMKKILTSTTPVQMIDITNLVVDEARVEAVKARYRNTSITYLSPSISFSKRHLTQGIMVDPEALQYFDKEFTDQYRELSGSNNLRSAVQAASKESSTFKVAPKFKAMVKQIKTLPGIVTKYTPLQWYARASVYISQQWYKKQIKEGHSMKAQALPITCNAGTNREYVNEISTALPVDSWVAMPFQSHGLNTFKTYDTIAFLATLNPKPEVVSIMNQLCPDYEPRLDYTLDQCVQSSTRCSIRDTKSKSRPLIIVTDETLARAVIKHLCGLPTLIDPEEFGVNVKVPVYMQAGNARVNSEEAKQAKREYNAKPENVKKRSASIKKLRSTEAYKKRTAWMLANSKYLRRIKSLTVIATKARKKQDAEKLEKVTTELATIKPLYAREKIVLNQKYAALLTSSK